MKNTFIGLAIALSISNAAQAVQFDPDLLLSEDLADLPRLSDVATQQVNGPAFAAVQPRVYVTFRFASCARQKFKARVNDYDGLFLVAVDQVRGVDCMGPRIDREYQLQIASDRIFAPVIVLNPVPATPSLANLRPDRPRLCTAIAGQLYNPRTGECVSFTNGCQMQTLRQSGYVAVPAGKCGR